MLVATGGALGAILRYLLTNISKSMFASSIYGTVSVNILGSFLIGYFITSNFGNNLPENFIKNSLVNFSMSNKNYCFISFKLNSGFN